MADSPVVDLFEGQLVSSCQCTKCGKVSRKFDPFQVLTLPIPQGPAPETEVAIQVSFTRYKDGQLQRKMFAVRVPNGCGRDTLAAAVRKHLDAMGDPIADGEDPVIFRGDLLEWKTFPSGGQDDGIRAQHPQGTHVFFWSVRADVALPFSENVQGNKRRKFGEPEEETNEPSASSSDASVASKAIVIVLRTRRKESQSLLANMKSNSVPIGHIGRLTTGSADDDWFPVEGPMILPDLMKPGTRVAEAREAIASFLESIGLGHPDFEVRNGPGYQEPLSEDELIFETSLGTWPSAELCVDLLANVPEHPIVKCDPPHLSWLRAGPIGASAATEPAAPTTLKECFNLFCKEELLSGDEAWACPRCKTKREAKKELRIHDYPPVLILHLKRFKQTMLGRVKDSRLVSFPRGDAVLDLDEWIAKDAPCRTRPADQERPKYKLFAGVYHSGVMGAGHYTAVAEVCPELSQEPLSRASSHQDGKWCDFNDANVTRMESKDKVSEHGAYLLFYRRVDYQDNIIEEEARTEYCPPDDDVRTNCSDTDIPPEHENPYANH